MREQQLQSFKDKDIIYKNKHTLGLRTTTQAETPLLKISMCIPPSVLT